MKSSVQYAIHDDELRTLSREWIPLRLLIVQKLRANGFLFSNATMLNEHLLTGRINDKEMTLIAKAEGLTIWRDEEKRCTFYRQDLPAEGDQS